MSVIARQSTARTLIVGPVLDADGVAVTGGVVGDFKISKNGGAPAALNGSATLTHRHTGFYSLALTASDLDTVGQAEITIDDTVNACPLRVVTVVEEAVYDALFVASATGILPDEAGVTTLLSRLTATRAGYLDNLSAGAVATAAKLLSYFQSALRKDVTVDADLGGNYDDATDSQEAIRDRGDAAWITATGFSTHSAADAATAVWAAGTRTLTSFGTLVADTTTAVWAAVARTLTAATNITSTGGTTVPQTGDSFARIGANGVSLSAVPWNAAWDAEVQSEVQDALDGTIADSIPADGTRPSVSQALYMLTQFMVERSVTSTTVTVKKPDGSTTLFTLTLNDGTSPTAITRAS